ncbi:MAG: hypothetical protein AUJ52_05985 [Elusimicrobia bacterium CG1_02_63_36]|nr:MAG: hypothetical protein AUJ52_05985 [Elusimicrobia bacterium CG1_02_63_36]PIP83271.1 MAG: hypothetical protein COR54_10505 [Elusimicrobia bacterium CG22_combo_CG10-13_8_21_14_all_63_91]PJA14927.1 MAG: hypothetical protein COX66_11325 [Elusimicrobia bacterium CG_4_10_14_0_2_um_filter_63_34]PJB26008.1 MAG: hypothetical protein CO113_05840 [Elusimicrobia bacterium CG_4_9_14_3_um_filter_62_55]
MNPPLRAASPRWLPLWITATTLTLGPAAFAQSFPGTSVSTAPISVSTFAAAAESAALSTEPTVAVESVSVSTEEVSNEVALEDDREDEAAIVEAPVKTPPAAELAAPPGFEPMRGLHLTAWVAGTGRLRRQFLEKASGTVVNAIIVPVKEIDGHVYIPGVASAREYGTQRLAIPRPEELVSDIHSAGMKAVARVVVFEDNLLARRKPEWAIQDVDGGVWQNRKRLTWADPYRREVWDYNFEIAQRAADAGFDEIQFDYIRYPSDGELERCRYSNPHHSSSTAVSNLLDFLKAARSRFHSQGIPVSTALFGLTTSADDDLGIGQDIDLMAALVDAVSPMMYPSHYARGAYGLGHPNARPFEVIDYGLRDATRRLGADAYKLRPYLQDFSLGVRYREHEVREQFRALEGRGVPGWILWNPQNRYTWDALRAPAPRSRITPPKGF